jgi:sulfatase maturation enzyme AslB (radical SAM superfamily)
MSIVDLVRNTAFSAAIHTALEYLEKNPEENIPKAMKLMDQALPDGWYEGQRAAFRKAIEEKGNWYQLIMKVYQLDVGVRKTFFQNFIVNSALKGSAIQNEVRKKENCNVPWAILLDPTSACNLRCTGCWAAEYGHKLNLSLETIDDIIRQGKKMGTYMYIYTGGEPMVRKKDLITLCERHPDCEFLSFTNGTLIDEDFCREMLRVKNFVPAISLEGFKQANDGRRGQGVFEKVMHAMDLLRKHKLPFGISTCYTSANYADISSEQFLQAIRYKIQFRKNMLNFIFCPHDKAISRRTELIPKFHNINTCLLQNCWRIFGNCFQVNHHRNSTIMF